MIRGYFSASGSARRPHVNALVEFHGNGRRLSIRFLIDTGADRTILSAKALTDAGVAPATQPSGVPTRGVGGAVQTRMVDATVTLGSVSVDVTLLVFEAPPTASAEARGPTLPSVLGLDLLSHFALVIDPRRDRVLLLEDAEAEALFPAGL